MLIFLNKTVMIFNFKSGIKLQFLIHFVMLITIFYLSYFGQNFDVLLLIQ